MVNKVRFLYVVNCLVISATKAVSKLVENILIRPINHTKSTLTPVKVIAQQVTLFEKKRDTLPFLVFNSLERKNDPCKSEGPTLYPL